MAKQGEINYLKRIGEEGQTHSVNKPFSDPLCGRYLMEIGAIISLLPTPPAKLLDLGCGTGWTSIFFAKYGFNVVGQDISDDAIALAVKSAGGTQNIEFHCGDYESMPYREEFDCAVFFESLHHAVDEECALRNIYRGLRKGGICVVSEPGRGHGSSKVALEAVKKYNVTEKSMPPTKVAQLARKIGFGKVSFYPHCNILGLVIYNSNEISVPLRHFFKIGLLRDLFVLGYIFILKRFSGLVVMVK